MSELIVRVQWAEGVLDVSDGGGGTARVIPVSSNAATSAAATEFGTMMLATLGQRDSVTVAAEDDPGSWPVLGDGHSVPGWDGTSSLQRLVARRVDIDANGYARLTPTWSSPEEEITARQQVAISRLGTGLAGGRSAGVTIAREASNGVPSGALRPVSIPPWAFDGMKAAMDAHEWRAETSTVITKTELLCSPTGPPSDDVSVKVKVNGVTQVTLTLPEDDTAWSQLGGILVSAGSILTCEVDSIGANTEAELEDLKLTVQFTAAPAALRVAA